MQFVWVSRVNERFVVSEEQRTSQVSFGLGYLRPCSEIKNVKVKGIFKYCILLAFQCLFNNANKSDFPKDTPVG